MQFCFMPGKCTVNSIIILLSLQEECLAKLMMLFKCSVDFKKIFASFPKKVMDLTMCRKQTGSPAGHCNHPLSRSSQTLLCHRIS